eukprot:619196-Amphidinium_carterae.1
MSTIRHHDEMIDKLTLQLNQQEQDFVSLRPLVTRVNKCINLINSHADFIDDIEAQNGTNCNLAKTMEQLYAATLELQSIVGAPEQDVPPDEGENPTRVHLGL